MFNFLRGMKTPMGGAQGGGMMRSAGGAPGGMMGRIRQGIQNPQFQQAAAGMGAQMMGLDPSLGMAAAQGMQQRRIQQGFDRSIQPIQRQQMPMPQMPRQQFDPRTLLQGSVQAQVPMGSENLGGGSWRDPRLAALFARNPTY